MYSTRCSSAGKLLQYRRKVHSYWDETHRVVRRARDVWKNWTGFVVANKAEVFARRQLHWDCDGIFFVMAKTMVE